MALAPTEIAPLPDWVATQLARQADKPTISAPHEPHGLTQADIEQMLGCIRPETLKGYSRDTWLHVLWALRTAERDDLPLMAVADSWSQTLPSYVGIEDVEKTFSEANGDVGLGTLWKLALAGGWRPTREQEGRLQPPVIAAQEFTTLPDQPTGESDIKDSTGESDIKDSAGAISLNESWQHPTEVKWLLPGLIEQDATVILAGPRNTFKSFFADDMAMQVAQAGHQVYVVCAEGRDFERRADAWVRTFAPTERTTIGARLFVFEGRIDMNSPEGFRLVENDFERLKISPALIVLDTFSKLSGKLEENSNTEVKVFVGEIDKNLTRKYKATVLLVAHTGHSEKARPRGASAFGADTDCELITSRTPGSDTVKITRERYKASPELPPLYLRSEVVDLGRKDQYGDPVTSLILRRVDPKNATDAALNAIEECDAFFLNWCNANPDKAVTQTELATKLKSVVWPNIQISKEGIKEVLKRAKGDNLIYLHGGRTRGKTYKINFAAARSLAKRAMMAIRDPAGRIVELSDEDSDSD